MTLRFLRSVSARMSRFLLHNVSIKCDSINGATNDLLSALIKTSHECVGAALGQRTKIMLERVNRATPHRWKIPVLIQKLAAIWKLLLVYNEYPGFEGASGDQVASLYEFSVTCWKSNT